MLAMPPPVPPIVKVTTTDKSGTITAGGGAQNAITANTSRKGWFVQNPPDATEILWIGVGVDAVAYAGIGLGPGQSATNQPGTIDTSRISVLGATTGHAFTAEELT